jgi:H+-transporting ATPase
MDTGCNGIMTSLLQVSIISQTLIFVTRSRGFFFAERPSLILIAVFAITQFFSTLIAVYADWSFTDIQGCGWSWAKIIWIWDIVWFFPLDLIKVNRQ